MTPRPPDVTISNTDSFFFFFCFVWIIWILKTSTYPIIHSKDKKKYQVFLSSSCDPSDLCYDPSLGSRLPGWEPLLTYTPWWDVCLHNDCKKHTFITIHTIIITLIQRYSSSKKCFTNDYQTAEHVPIKCVLTGVVKPRNMSNKIH